MPPDIPFSSLPLRRPGPRGNAWGLHGPSDQLGTLNYLTPSNTLQAIQEIEHGIRISTDWILSGLPVPAFARQKFHHQITYLTEPAKRGLLINDDIISLNTQCSSQWDGFRHFGFHGFGGGKGVFYNGVTQEEILSGDLSRNGIDRWVDSGGIVGRGVLLDWAGWKEQQGMTPDELNKLALAATPIPVADLLAVAQHQNTSFRKGDILFIRSGCIRAFTNVPQDIVVRYLSDPDPPIIGVESSQEFLEWAWNLRFAAVCGDMVAFEMQPLRPGSEEWRLHEWLIAGWGCPLGELFDLERLAETCKEKRKWTFFYSSMPLKVPGGVASPPNGVAII